MENAKNYFNEQITILKKDDDKLSDALIELSNLLGIDSCNHIEIFDNAHIFGSFNVSGISSKFKPIYSNFSFIF